MSEIQLPEFTKEATFGDLMPPSIAIAEAGDTELGEAYVQAYVHYLVRDWDRTPEDAHSVVMANIGYWAGYYDWQTMELVNEFYGAVHPVFGTRKPTAEEAFDAGAMMAMGVDPEVS